MGGIIGALLAVSWVVWSRVRAAPCPGAVTIEFHPPLADPGLYSFQLDLGAPKPCQFSLALPQSGTPAAATGCGMARELRTQSRDGAVSVAALTFAAAPERFHFRLLRNAEPIYELDIEPKYAPYETARADDKHFCGERARVVPACVHGSSECEPFPSSCTGPDACARGQACCLTPEWGRDFGPRAASECAPRNSCFAHFGHLACHADSDCPADFQCMDSALSHGFTPALRTCEPR